MAIDLNSITGTYPVTVIQFPAKAQVPLQVYLQKKPDLTVTHNTLTPICKAIFSTSGLNTTGDLRRFTLSYRFTPTSVSSPTGIELAQKLRFSFFADDGSFFFFDLPAPKLSLFTDSSRQIFNLKATDSRLEAFISLLKSTCESPTGSVIKWHSVQFVR